MLALVARLIAAARQRLQHRTAQRAATRALKAHRRYWNDSVVLSLVDLLHGTETKASGRVQLLTLADFRAHVGGLWETYGEKVVMIAETTIARMIGKGNTFIPQGEDAWLLLFHGLTPADAQDRADAIAGRIGEKLVGENFAPDIPPPPLTVILESAGVVRADGSLDREAFHAVVERARRPEKKTPKAAAQPARAPALTVSLRPGWSTGTEILDTFSIRPHGPIGEDLLTDPQTVFTAAMAEDLCAAALNQVSEMDARKLRGRIVLPLPLASLLGSEADRLRQQLLGASQRLRLLHLRLDVIRIPPQVAIETIAALREALRSLVREVGLAVDPAAPNDPLFTLGHAVFVAETAALAPRDDRQMGELLKALRRQAGHQRLAVGGLRTRAQVLDAVALGVDEISGPAVSGEFRHLPERLTVMSRSSFSP